MTSNAIHKKGLLSKLLEKGIRILVKKECKKISNLKIDIISSSTQIIKGEIQKINIIAEDINFKDLLLDQLELEASHLKINFNLINKKLNFKNNPIIKFKISLSQKSLRQILLSNNWNWIEKMISKEILNQRELKDIIIKNSQLLIRAHDKNKTLNGNENINIITDRGKIYLENKKYNKFFQIPIEDKIYIRKVNVENDLINIFASSSISI